MLFSLGGFKFQIPVLAESLVKNTDFGITAVERINNTEALYAAKKPKEEITINCITLPVHGAKNTALDKLYALARTQTAHTLVDGRGKFYGKYVIKTIEETLSNFLDNGSFLSQNFSLTIARAF
jgi:phage protein U